MKPAIKSKLPLIFLIGMSITWAYYYQSKSVINDFGAANYELLFLIDGLLVLPILCFLCIKDKKQAGIKALMMVVLVVLIGSYIIPEQSKFIWQYLESGRYMLLAVFLLLEVMAIATVYWAVKAALLKRVDPDLAVAEPIGRLVGTGALSKLLAFETRMWTFALLAKNITFNQFNGEKHFSYHLKDGAQSNLLGFIMLIMFEFPIMHLLLHFMWSPMAANIVTVVTFFGLVFFVAEYRAVSRRPISLGAEQLFIRCGIYQPFVIALSNIESINYHAACVKRSKNVKRFNYSGVPNVVITLVEPMVGKKHIFLGLDKPVEFVVAVNLQKSLLYSVVSGNTQSGRAK